VVPWQTSGDLKSEVSLWLPSPLPLLSDLQVSPDITLPACRLVVICRLASRSLTFLPFTIVGPLAGGFLSDAAGWRWLYWLHLILSGIVWLVVTFTVPETYAPTILAKRAKILRKETGESDWVTETDLDMRPLGERMRIFLVMPLKLLFGELIVLLISLYMSVLYGLLYMFFIAFPIVFEEGKGFSAGLAGLTL